MMMLSFYCFDGSRTPVRLATRWRPSLDGRPKPDRLGSIVAHPCPVMPISTSAKTHGDAVFAAMSFNIPMILLGQMPFDAGAMSPPASAAAAP